MSLKVTSVEVERWGPLWRVRTRAEFHTQFPMLDHDPIEFTTGPLLFRSWAENVKRKIEARFYY